MSGASDSGCGARMVERCPALRRRRSGPFGADLHVGGLSRGWRGWPGDGHQRQRRTAARAGWDGERRGGDLPQCDRVAPSSAGRTGPWTRCWAWPGASSPPARRVPLWARRCRPRHAQHAHACGASGDGSAAGRAARASAEAGLRSARDAARNLSAHHAGARLRPRKHRPPRYQDWGPGARRCGGPHPDRGRRWGRAAGYPRRRVGTRGPGVRAGGRHGPGPAAACGRVGRAWIRRAHPTAISELVRRPECARRAHARGRRPAGCGGTERSAGSARETQTMSTRQMKSRWREASRNWRRSRSSARGWSASPRRWKPYARPTRSRKSFCRSPSHELKTPLTVLQARTQATQRRLLRMGHTEAAAQFSGFQAALTADALAGGGSCSTRHASKRGGWTSGPSRATWAHWWSPPWTNNARSRTASWSWRSPATRARAWRAIPSV